jgi:carboxypeptidase Taq
MSALPHLRQHLAELTDLQSLAYLAEWDQRVMMPADGAAGRAHHLATLERVRHERATAPQLGAWLEELEGEAQSLDAIDRDIVRIARRDYEQARRVPADLAAELSGAHSAGESAWVRARATSDFGELAPYLRRNVELARELAGHLGDAKRPYDALLDTFDHGLTAAEVQRAFARLTDVLPALVAQRSAAQSAAPLDVPRAALEAAVPPLMAGVGVTGEGWRVDVAPHPFSTWMSPRDTRVTTRYDGAGMEAVLAALHEFGHGLYERQVDPQLARTNLGAGTSMSAHESQSKLWENHVGRNPAFAPVLAAQLGAGGFAIEPAALHAGMVAVRPSLIRVSADPTTYPLHIVLRFELELALIEGTLDVDDLPAAWNDAVRRLLGVEVPDDASGVLQDVHWAVGAFGYFPSYALGVLIAAQLWEALEADIGSQSDALARGEVAAVRDWLGDRVHRHGRRRDTVELVRHATGKDLEPDAFLRHVDALTAA